MKHNVEEFYKVNGQKFYTMDYIIANDIPKCKRGDRNHGYSVAMYLTDGVIIVLSGLRFTNGFSYELEMVIYGIIAIWGTAILTDIIILNAKTRRTVFIITEKPIEIRDMLKEAHKALKEVL